MRTAACTRWSMASAGSTWAARSDGGREVTNVSFRRVSGSIVTRAADHTTLVATRWSVLSNGVLSTSIPTPEQSGLVQDMTLMLWDPLETELLSVYDMPVFQLDFDAPELLPSAITDTISRYKLEEVEIGVNIAENQAWSSELKLTCQIQSLPH